MENGSERVAGGTTHTHEDGAAENKAGCGLTINKQAHWKWPLFFGVIWVGPLIALIRFYKQPRRETEAYGPALICFFIAMSMWFFGYLCFKCCRYESNNAEDLESRRNSGEADESGDDDLRAPLNQQSSHRQTCVLPVRFKERCINMPAFPFVFTASAVMCLFYFLVKYNPFISSASNQGAQEALCCSAIVQGRNSTDGGEFPKNADCDSSAYGPGGLKFPCQCMEHAPFIKMFYVASYSAWFCQLIENITLSNITVCNTMCESCESSQMKQVLLITGLFIMFLLLCCYSTCELKHDDDDDDEDEDDYDDEGGKNTMTQEEVSSERPSLKLGENRRSVYYGSLSSAEETKRGDEGNIRQYSQFSMSDNPF